MQQKKKKKKKKENNENEKKNPEINKALQNEKRKKWGTSLHPNRVYSTTIKK